MSEISPYGVLNLCNEQGIDLNCRVQLASDVGYYTGIDHLYTPTPTTAAFAVAADELRKYPDEQLANREIEIPEEFRSDLGKMALIGLINDSINPQYSEQENRNFFTEYIRRVDTCRDGETYYAQMYKDMSQGDFAGQIIADQNETPIFLKKQNGAASSLLLEDITVNGVRYPAGSLARVDTVFDAPDADEEAVLPLEMVEGVGVMRLSQFMFQEKNENETNILRDAAGFEKTDYELSQDLTVKHFQSIAQRMAKKHNLIKV